MRRLLAILITFALLMGIVSSGFAAGTEADAENMDIVILIDQSNSMCGGKDGKLNQKNDLNNYRMEAANMIIAMAGTGSSVAVVTFAGTAEAISDDFFRLDNNQNRSSFMETIAQKVANKQVRENTDCGEAFAVAYNLLAERPAENKKMIIMLTDGKNDFSKDSKGRYSKEIYTWNEDAEKYAKIGTQSRPVDTFIEMENNLAREVAGKLAGQEVVVHTIGLKGGGEVDEALLQEIADMTGGTYTQATPSTAARLPDFFADIFGSSIGSCRIEAEVTYDPVERTFTVLLPVLNDEVAEANMFLNVEMIDKDSMKLTCEGSERRLSDYVLKSNKYWMIKLMDPTPGMWRLTFSPKDSDLTEDEINDLKNGILCSILYNYDIDLAFTCGQDSDLADGLRAQKSDTLEIQAQFVAQDGSIVSDPNLYRTMEDYQASYGGDAREWFPIQVNWTLCEVDETGDEPQDIERQRGETALTPNFDKTAFEGSIDLKTIYQGTDGNLLDSHRNYSLVFTTTGAGLDRSFRIPLNVTNSTLEASQLQRSVVRTVEKVGDDPAETSRIEIEMPAYDLDHEMIRYDQITPNDDGISWTWEESTLVGQLDYDADTGLFSALEQTDDGPMALNREYRLHANDKEGEMFDFTISVSLVSATRDGSHTVSVSLSSDGRQDEDGCLADVRKNSEITVRVIQENPDDGADGRIALTVDGADCELAPDGTFTWNAGTHARESVEVKVGYTYNGTPVDSKMLTYTVINHGPKAISGTKWDSRDAEGKEQRVPVSFNPMPFVNTFVDKPNVETDQGTEYVGLNAAEILQDEDNETITYTVRDINDGQLAEVKLLEGSESAFRIYPKKAGTLTFTVHAEDEDGAGADFPITISLTDLNAKWKTLLITVGIALAALIVLILLLREIAKPLFARDAAIQVYEGEASIETETNDLPRSKKTKALLSYIGTELREKLDADDKELLPVQIKPSRRKTEILIAVTKRARNLELTLDGVPVGKRWASWREDHDLDINGVLRLRYVLLNDQDSDYGPSGDMGGSEDDSFNSDF